MEKKVLCRSQTHNQDFEGGEQNINDDSNTSSNYSEESQEEKKEDFNCDPNFDNFEMGTCTKIYVYILDVFGCFGKCKMKRNKKIEGIKKEIDKA